MRTETSRGPFEGLLVVNLTQVVSGAVTTMLMADLGATVVKIEPPEGEVYRRAGADLTGAGGKTSLNFVRFSRGKHSIALDLKSADGREVLAALIAKADVLVENFRPGVMDRFGFSHDRLRELNPRLVYASVSGFGHDDLYPSPYRDRPAYAIIVEAMAGLMHLAGTSSGPPMWMGFAMADIFAGTLALAGVAMALRERDSTGVGPRVDIAMYDGAVFMNDLAVAAYSTLGEVLGRGQYAFQSPWGPFTTSDGYVVIAVMSDAQWQALCGVIERPDLAGDESLRAGVDRVARHDDVIAPAISVWTTTRTKAECAEILGHAGVPAAPVNTAAELMDCPQLAAREMLIDVQDPHVGKLRLVGNPIKIEGQSGLRSPAIARLGEDTEWVLADLLGLEPAERERLRLAGAFGKA